MYKMSLACLVAPENRKELKQNTWVEGMSKSHRSQPERVHSGQHGSNLNNKIISRVLPHNPNYNTEIKESILV